jgi:hypothetical protein
MTSRSLVPLLGNGLQFPSVLNNGVISDNGTKELEHSQYKKIPALKERDAAPEFAVQPSKITDVSNMDISHSH